MNQGLFLAMKYGPFVALSIALITTAYYLLRRRITFAFVPRPIPQVLIVRREVERY